MKFIDIHLDEKDIVLKIRYANVTPDPNLCNTIITLCPMGVCSSLDPYIPHSVT